MQLDADRSRRHAGARVEDVGGELTHQVHRMQKVEEVSRAAAPSSLKNSLKDCIRCKV
jgi:hypothetical protein